MERTKATTLTDLASGAIMTKAQHVEKITKAELNFSNQEIENDGKIKSGLQDCAKQTLLVFALLMIFALTASAQKSAVLDAFSKHGIDAGILNDGSLMPPTDFSYDFSQTTTTAGKTISTTAKFDASAPKQEQWTVISADGKTPSKSDINSFRKNHSKQTPAPAEESSYKVEKETPDYLVISYKQNPDPADKEAAVLKDCRQYMTVNLKTKKLEKVQTLNEKPLKIKILSAEKFDLVTTYNWNEQAKRYFAVNENLNILAKFMGQTIPVQTITEYSNYSKK